MAVLSEPIGTGTCFPKNKIYSVIWEHQTPQIALLNLKQKTPVRVHWGCIYIDLIGRGNFRYYPCFCAVAFKASLATITISTRRLAARPASVLLSAIGSEKPLPMVTNLEDGTP